MANNDYSIPEVRPFQFDDAGLQNLSSCANLFRGDINLAQKLFTLPARVDNNLDVQVSLLYQSNIYQQAVTRNLEAPTGVVGLGWSLPLEYIELDNSNSPTPGLWTYNYWSNGIANQLMQNPGKTQLTTLGVSDLGNLQNGSPVPAQLISTFMGLGLSVSAKAISSQVTDSEWLIEDDTNQIDYSIDISGTNATIFTGGISYQLSSYRFWRITYYSKYERWEIIDENGIISSYGGLDTGSNEGIGRSIDWTVVWKNGGSVLWQGASSQIKNQQRCASAWRLQSKKNHWGETVMMEYNTDAGGNTLPGVSLAVGEGGLSYTKAVYLTKITDAFGRQALFNYKKKLWGNEPGSAREFADPYNPANPMSMTSTAWQNRYEMLYLDSVDVLDRDGKTELIHVDLEYAPTAGNGSPCVNLVSGAQGSLTGDLQKRFLTGITIKNGIGDSSPQLKFDYFFEENENDGSSLGAIKTATHPLGGLISYEYTKHELAIERSLSLPRPGDNFEPMVWSGPDYSVIIWKTSSEIQLSVYTWTGQWITWTPENNGILFNNSNGYGELLVLAKEDHFAVALEHSGTTDVWIFQKNNTHSGQWNLINKLNDGPSSGVTLSYNSSNDFSLQGGDHFLVYMQDGKYDLVTWLWAKAAWELQSEQTLNKDTILTASNEYFTLFETSSGSLKLNYLNTEDQWIEQPSVTIDQWSSSPVQNVVMTPGKAMIAIVAKNNPRANQLGYNIFVVQWGSDYNAFTAFSNFFRDTINDHLNISLNPVIIDDSLIGVRGHAIRFDGASWSSQDANETRVSSASAQNFAYGPDYLLEVIEINRSGSGNVVAFNANALSFDSQNESNPNYPGSGDGSWPHSGSTNYLMMGWNLYNRGTSNSWGSVLDQTAFIDLQNLVKTELNANGITEINDLSLFAQLAVVDDPNYIAFLVSYRSGGPDQFAIVTATLLNGQIGKQELFSGERYPIASDYNNGVIPPTNGSFSAGALVSFVSDSKFENAKELKLRKYSTNSINGSIEHRAIQQIGIQNGFESNPYVKFYDYDVTQATADKTANVIKYHKIGIGNAKASDIASTPSPSLQNIPLLNGKTFKYYLNGSIGDFQGNYYDVMDGLEWKVETFDSRGNQTSGYESVWTGFNKVGSDPANTGPDININGAYILQTSQTQMLQGVSVDKKLSYSAQADKSPYSGQPKAITTQGYGGSGQLEVSTEYHLYGFEVNPAYQLLNILSAMAQEKHTWRLSSSKNETLVSSRATTFRNWSTGTNRARWATEAKFNWNGDIPVGDFPYSSYKQGDSPDGWTLDIRSIARATYGQVLSSKDASQQTTSILLAQDTYPVAKLIGSDVNLGESIFFAFEGYEDLQALTIENGQTIQTDSAFGTSSLQLQSQGSISFSVAITPGVNKYVLGCWFKMTPGTLQTDNLSWAIVPYKGDVAQASIGQKLSTKEAGWTYQTVGIPIQDGVTKLVITGTNETKSVMGIDGLLSIPIDALLKGKTYDALSMLTSAQMAADGTMKRYRHDRFHRLIGHTKTACDWEEIQLRFLSRSVSSGFSIESPNNRLRVTSPGGGRLETFIDGGDWQNRWIASNATSHWQTSSGMLNHTSDESDTLTWKNWEVAPQTAALFFQLWNSDVPSGISIKFGNNYSITYSLANGYQLLNATNQVIQSALFPSSGTSSQWLLMCLEGTIVFAIDGQVILSSELDYGSVGNFTLQTGPNQLQLSDLSVIANPRVSSLFSDGLGLERQKQELWLLNGKSDARTEQAVYDYLQRKVAKTKSAPALFGSGAQKHLFVYRPGFCNVNDFLISADNSMTGDINDYYQGQQETNGTYRSDDKGYPYSGLAYEASPISRVVEEGKAGKDYAINTLISENDRNTRQLAYTNNAEAYENLPADEYKMMTILSPTKVQTASLTDFSSKVLANTVTKDQVVSSKTLAASTPNGTESTVNLQLPNAFSVGQTRQGDDFKASMTVNPLGRKTSQNLPSTGENIYIENGINKLRFVLSGYNTDGSGWVYNKYDRMGRLIESGSLIGQWSQKQLEPMANQIDWPNESGTYKVTRSLQYDGNGMEPSSLGKPTQIRTVNSFDQGNMTIEETFTYDQEGRKQLQTTSIEGLATQNGSYTTVYNNLDEVIQINYPSGCEIESVYYSFDESGKISAIGSKPGSSDLATADYDVQGYLSQLLRNNGALKTLYSYNSPGWLLSKSDTASGNSLLQIDYQYFSDGRPSNRVTTYQAKDPISESFIYDGQNGLVQTTVQGDDLGNEKITEIDPNGNILKLTQDNTNLAFVTENGSDRLASITLGQENIPVGYSNDGWLNTYGDLSISHDIVLRNVNEISQGSNTWLYGYGNTSSRVMTLDVSASSNNIFEIRRPDGKALALFENSQCKQQIWGPGGHILSSNGSRFFPLSDKLGSVFSVTDSGNKVVGKYRYRPFGEPMASENTTSGIIGPTFMLQEYNEQSGLYNFHSRLYDPVTRRFISPDPAQEYASPYVFVGNDPLSLTDPSGQVSLWGQALLLLGNVTIWAVGAALAPETGGASLTAAEGATDAIDTSSESLGIAEGTEEAIKTTAQTAAKKEASGGLIRGLASGTLKGAGVGGGLYVFMTPHDQINWSDYGSSVLWGAIGGATDFAMDKGFESLYSGLKNMVPDFSKAIEGKFSESLIKKLGVGFKNAVEYDVNAVLKNVTTGHHWDDGLSTREFFEKMGEGIAIDMFSNKVSKSKFVGKVKAGDTNAVGKVAIAATVSGIGFLCWGAFSGFKVSS